MAPTRDHGEETESVTSATERFQVLLAGCWRDVEMEEDQALKAALAEGRMCVSIELRGFSYEYDLETMEQRNLATGKARSLRAPACCVKENPLVIEEVVLTTGNSGDTAKTSALSRKLSLLRGKAKALKIPFSFGCAAKTIGATAGAATVFVGSAALTDEYLLDGEMGVARGLLEAGDEVHELAGDCGHDAESFFSHMF